jgi:hypothetical protein
MMHTTMSTRRNVRAFVMGYLVAEGIGGEKLRERLAQIRSPITLFAVYCSDRT